MVWFALVTIIFVIGLLATGAMVVKAIWALIIAPIFAVSATVGVFITLLPIAFILLAVLCFVRWLIYTPTRRCIIRRRRFFR